ncbi:MAG: response regulator [Roseinatronobacter sp.]|nr:response regulator [Roseinatronobacter sp.]
MRIVIVEDHAMIREILVMTLRHLEAYEVAGFATGQAGIAACLENADLAIFDHHLPDMTGTEAVEHLRADSRTQHLPIIVVTGEDDTATRLNAIRAGATDFLEKPVNLDELRLRVRNLLALHRAQKTAKDRGNLLETLISNSDAAIAVVDVNGPRPSLLYASKALQTLLGLGEDQALECHDAFLGQTAKPSEDRRQLETALQDKVPGRFIVQITPENGLPFWDEVSLQPVPGIGRDAQFIVISHQNISDMVLMRADLSRLEGRLAAIANMSRAWFFEIDNSLRLSYMSEGMIEDLGLKPDDVSGLHVDDLNISLEDSDTKGATLGTMLLPVRQPQLHDLRKIALPDGRQRMMQISMAVFHDDSGSFAGYRGYASDVSTLAAARDAAQRASRAKSTFLATMSHEMRTPLTAILGMADLLAHGGASPQQCEYLTLISKAAHELSDLLGDVLDMAWLEEGPLKLHSTAFDILALWQKITQEHQCLGQEKGLEMQITVQGAHADLRLGDAARFGQILRHLLSNSVKFTEAGAVRAALDITSPDHVLIKITDTGIGIPPDRIESAFEPFVQLDDGVARRFGGSGTGLSIARWIANSMQGSLTITSQPGVGTTARLHLPLPQTKAIPPKRRRVDLGGRAVLVTDDSATNRRLLELMLRNMNARVTLCPDAATALQAWARTSFDLILLDINMPNMAGTELIREIRKTEAAAGRTPVPAIAVTANAMPDQVRDYLAAGFDKCLAKPFTSQSLTAALQDLV